MKTKRVKMVGATTRASPSGVETALSAESGGTGAWSDLLDTSPRQAPSLQAKDPLIMVNVGTDQEVREIPVSALIDEEAVRKIKAVLVEYRDCFAWSFAEMPGLSREVVEHRLPIKSGFRPFKQLICMSDGRVLND